MSSRERDEALDRFRRGYQLEPGNVFERIEAEVLGVVYKANGFTTVAQADTIAERLDLGPGRSLLEMGAGCGWPSLYLCDRFGVQVTMTDVVGEGLSVAMQRARRDGLDGRAAVVEATAHELPFRAQSFDAVVHTDLLC
jgi:ubiquinone/menaquinone biosynthesis C-methylase UbiE